MQDRDARACAPAQDLSEDLALMRDAALAAGHLAMDFKSAGGARVWDKSPGHPVTEADRAVNRLLSERLALARPGYGWLSEETAQTEEARARRRVWVVDPIDGTRAYMRKEDPHWCIGLAVVENGAPVASLVYAPALGAMYEARRGGGAFRNGVQLFASARAVEQGARLIAARGMVEHAGWREPWPSVVLADPKPNATLLRLALVASGEWDGVVVLWRKSDWDLAAGALLVEEAGGLATTHSGERFEFNRAAPAQRSLVAAGKGLHPLLVRRTRAVSLPDPNTAPPVDPTP